MDIAWIGGEKGAEEEEDFARAVGWGVAGWVSKGRVEMVAHEGDSQESSAGHIEGILKTRVAFWFLIS